MITYLTIDLPIMVRVFFVVGFLARDDTRKGRAGGAVPCSAVPCRPSLRWLMVSFLSVSVVHVCTSRPDHL